MADSGFCDIPLAVVVAAVVRAEADTSVSADADAIGRRSPMSGPNKMKSATPMTETSADMSGNEFGPLPARNMDWFDW